MVKAREMHPPPYPQVPAVPMTGSHLGRRTTLARLMSLSKQAQSTFLILQRHPRLRPPHRFLPQDQLPRPFCR